MELAADLIELVDRSAVHAGELRGALDNGVQYRGEVERRADRLPDLAECLELANGLRELRRAGFEFGNQPHVLNGDHRLVGERLQQRHLGFGKWAGLWATDGNRANRDPFTDQGYGEVAAKVSPERQRAHSIVKIEQQVGNLHDVAGQDRPGRRVVAAWRPRKNLPHRFGTVLVQVDHRR